jgi:hypothetical protein
MGEYPKYMHHASKPPVMVESAQQQAELGSEWSEKYIYQAYPKCKYHWTSDPATVKDADEEARLGGGWADSPAAFDAYRGARPARTDQQDVVKWVDEWPVPGLSSHDRKKIKAQLLRADAAFCRLPDGQSADVDCMRFAFDGVARVLFESGILTEQLLAKDVPEFVWNSAIAGGWWRFASETPRDIFPERLGQYWVWRDESRDWRGLFRAETAEWQARLLEVSAQGTNRQQNRKKKNPTGSKPVLRIRGCRQYLFASPSVEAPGIKTSTARCRK